jgi:hypothetical protein
MRIVNLSGDKFIGSGGLLVNDPVMGWLLFVAAPSGDGGAIVGGLRALSHYV